MGKRAAAAPDGLEAQLRNISFFSDLDRVHLARLVGALEVQEVEAGISVITEGEEADGLYLLESGRVAVTVKGARGEHQMARLQGPDHFGELGLLLDRRTSTVRALSPLKLWKLPRERFERLVRDSPSLGLAVATSAVQLLEERQRERAGAPRLAARERRPFTVELVAPGRPLEWRLAGLLLALIVPLVLWRLAPPAGLSPEGWHVTLVGLGATIALVFEPLPDFVVLLLMAAAWGIAGLAPLNLSLSGIGSSAWFVALGALGLAVAMSRSGLLLRFGLFLLRVFPSTHLGQVLALLLGGLLLTPAVPISLARVAAAAPLAREIGQALRYPVRSRASAAVGFAGLLGYGTFGSVFLTGLVMNFFVLELLPQQLREHFDWTTWLLAAAPAGAVLLVGSLAALLLLFRPEVKPALTAEARQRQELVLGPMSHRERVTVAAFAVLLVGLILQPALQLDKAWVAVAALAVALAGGGLDREAFRSSIDWGFLITFGVLLGTGPVLLSHGVAGWLGQSLVPLAHAVGSPALLVLLLAVFVVAIRYTMPWFPESLMLALALIPAAHNLGLSPWVVGFTILLAAEASPVDLIQVTSDVTRGEMFSDDQARKLSVAHTAVVLLAIAASIPYWWATGLLTG